MNRIFSKMWDYRIWYHLEDQSDIKRSDFDGRIMESIQEHYSNTEADDPEFVKGVTSVTILFPKSLETAVTKQLAQLPSPLATGEEPFRKEARKVLHVRNKKGTEISLPLFEEILDIDVKEKNLFIGLINPSDPPWEIHESDNPIDISIKSREVMNSNEASEEVAWNKVAFWIQTKKLIISNEREHPNGEYEFPDYRATIQGIDYDIELTSVPDLGRWTIKSGYRKLEEIIQRVARQPGETMADVDQEVIRILGKKSSRVQSNPCILIISNWSSYSLRKASYWEEKDLSKFDLVIVIEGTRVWCTNGKRMMS